MIAPTSFNLLSSVEYAIASSSERSGLIVLKSWLEHSTLVTEYLVNGVGLNVISHLVPTPCTVLTFCQHSVYLDKYSIPMTPSYGKSGWISRVPNIVWIGRRVCTVGEQDVSSGLMNHTGNKCPFEVDLVSISWIKPYKFGLSLAFSLIFFILMWQNLDPVSIRKLSFTLFPCEVCRTADITKRFVGDVAGSHIGKLGSFSSSSWVFSSRSWSSRSVCFSCPFVVSVDSLTEAAANSSTWVLSISSLPEIAFIRARRFSICVWRCSSSLVWNSLFCALVIDFDKWTCVCSACVCAVSISNARFMSFNISRKFDVIILNVVSTSVEGHICGMSSFGSSLLSGKKYTMFPVSTPSKFANSRSSCISLRSLSLSVGSLCSMKCNKTSGLCRKLA